jgi:tetratricopeptide (TPR) repeat protein
VARKSFRIGGYPDLSLSPEDVAIEPPQPIEGESVRFKVRFRNEGEGPAAGFSARIYEKGEGGTEQEIRQKADGIYSVGWPRYEDVLDPGEGAEFDVFWHPSDNVGPHRFAVVIDSANDVAEKDENNNRVEIEADFAPGFVALREMRAEAWTNLDFHEAERLNQKMASFLDAEMDRYGGDLTWVDYDWFAQRGFCALVAGDLNRAEQVLTWGIGFLPVYIPNYRLGASVALRRGRVHEAKVILATMEREASFNSPYWHEELGSGDPLYLAAEREFEAGNPEAAQAALEICVRQTPVNSEAWWLLYQVRSDLGRPEGALSALRGYLDAGLPSQDPGVPFYQAIYETLVYRLNRPEEAGYWVGKAIESYPENNRFHCLLPYLEYSTGMPAAEVRAHARRVLEEHRSLRGLIAALYLLIVRLDVELDDMDSVVSDYANFVFHSSKTSPRSGFRAWPRVALARRELDPDLRVFTGEDMIPLEDVPLAFQLEKSEVPEPAELPEPASMESPLTLTVDLGHPRRADALLLSVEEHGTSAIDVEISVLEGDRERKVAKAPAISGNICAARFPPVRSRYWRFRIVSRDGTPLSIKIRDLLLLEAPPARAS